MSSKNIFSSIKSNYLWWNIAAMIVILILIGLIFRYGVEFYTNHGSTVEVPNVVHLQSDEAIEILDDAGLNVVVSDTGYVKSLSAGCVLEQSLASGTIVKPGRIIYLTINSSSSPTIILPDVIDNSSYRTALAKLKALGFKLSEPEYIPGEKDWVYGITCRGKKLETGARISIEDIITIQVGDGRLDENDSIAYINPTYNYNDNDSTGGNNSEFGSEADDFEVVTGPEQ